MSKRSVGICCALLIFLASTPIAIAQTFQEKLIGAWTLVEGSEVFADGKKVVPWGGGNLILGRSGNMSFFVMGKDRAPTGSVRTPAGPMVAYYGTYTVNEAAGTVTYKITDASSPAFAGLTREQKVTFNGDQMTTTGSSVNTPEGTITPVNVWRRSK